MGNLVIHNMAPNCYSSASALRHGTEQFTTSSLFTANLFIRTKIEDTSVSIGISGTAAKSSIVPLRPG